jgi:hypothetical protein
MAGIIRIGHLGQHGMGRVSMQPHLTSYKKQVADIGEN